MKLVRPTGLKRKSGGMGHSLVRCWDKFQSGTFLHTFQDERADLQADSHRRSTSSYSSRAGSVNWANPLLFATVMLWPDLTARAE
jgi:hypothetical protein